MLRPQTSVKLSLRLPPTADGKTCGELLKEALLRDPPNGAQVTLDLEKASTADTRFPTCRNDIIASIEQVCTLIEPDRIYTMCGEDHHQDHRTVHEASIIACRHIPQILCYESPSTLPQFAPQVFEDISAQLELKIHALREHASQGDRHYMQESHLRCHAQFRGQQIGIGPSEGFLPYRLVL